MGCYKELNTNEILGRNNNAEIEVIYSKFHRHIYKITVDGYVYIAFKNGHGVGVTLAGGQE